MDDRSKLCSLKKTQLSYINLYSFKSGDFSFCRGLLRNASENLELQAGGKKLVISEIKNIRCILENQYFKRWLEIAFPFIET